MTHPGAFLYAGMLTAPEALLRVEGISRWEEYGAGPDEIVPLLGDPAPVTHPHGGRVFLVEVRARALVALQDHYRAGRVRWDLGPVKVRRGMPVDEAEERAAALPPSRRAAVMEAAERFLADRVRPFERDRAACLAYAVLLELGEVSYETQEVDGRTWLTPLQQEIHDSQMAGARPVPHLRFEGERGPVGYVYRAGGQWVLDFGESPEGREIAAAVRRWRDVVPRARYDAVPGDPAEWLRGLAAALTGRHQAQLVVEEGQ